MADSAEVLRIARLLERLILFKKIPIRQVEKQLHVSNGTLARLFSGRVELKLRHILDILEVLQVSPQTFFKLAYEIEDPEQIGAAELLSHLRKIGLPDAIPPPPISRAEVESVVVATLERLGLTPAPPAGPSRPRSRRSPRSR
ncbi:MAG TPA: helix-turn-helix transcriptional regulator [Thermoanaerobaculia bacterium]|jgi:transcriptional regulator with XRE-family HTH domain